MSGQSSNSTLNAQQQNSAPAPLITEQPSAPATVWLSQPRPALLGESLTAPGSFLFLLINLLGLYAISAFESYATVTEEMRETFAAFFVAAAGIVALLANQNLWRAAYADLLIAKLNRHGSFALFYLYLLGFNGYWLIHDYESFVASNRPLYLVFNLFITSLTYAAVNQLRSFLGRRVRFNIADLVQDVQVVEEVGAGGADSKSRLKALSELRIGDLLLLKAGELIPADGEVVTGTAEVEERRLSLLSENTQKVAGSSVWAGSVVRLGELVYRISSLPGESMITNFSGNINEANKKLLEREVGDARANLLAWVVLFCSVFSLVFWSRHDETLEFIELVCGSILAISLMVNVFEVCARALPALKLKLFQSGLYLPDITTLQSLAHSKIFLECDCGAQEPGVTTWSMEVLDDRIDSQALAALVFAVTSTVDEAEYASLLRSSAEWQRATSRPEIDKVLFYPGQGCIANIGDVECTLGSESFLIARGIHLNPCSTAVGQEAKEVAAPVMVKMFMALDDVVVASLQSVTDFSQDQKSTASLRKQGLQVAYRHLGDAAQADSRGKALGYELAEVSSSAELSKEYFQPGDKPGSICFITDPRIARRSKDWNANLCTISLFDDYLWDVGSTSATVFGGSRRTLIAALLTLGRRTKLLEQLKTASLATIGALLVACFFGTLACELVLMIGLLGVLSVGILVINKFCFKIEA